MSVVLACTAFAVAWIHGSTDKKTGERRHDSNVASELSREILAAEDIAFDAASEEAARRIRRLEAMSSDSSFLWPTSNDFHQHLESIEARLSRIQADPFPVSPTNLDEGK